MKHHLLIGLLTLISLQSQALISDKFHCRMELQDFETKAKAMQDQEFFVSRLPTTLETPDNKEGRIQMTVGHTNMNLQLGTAKGQFYSSATFYYKHAKRDLNGITEARQWACFGLSGDYCQKAPSSGSDSDLFLCATSHLACAEMDGSPFDDGQIGWSPVSLFDGIPSFNQQELAPISYDITDDDGNLKGNVSLKCELKGTFN